MFGDCYTPTAYGLPIEDGKYLIRLNSVRESNWNGRTILKISISIKDNPDCVVTDYSLWDCENEYDPEKLHKWNTDMTKFFDAFGIDKTQNPFDTQNWCGKTGFVYIGKDKKGYSKVMYPVILTAEERKNAGTGTGGFSPAETRTAPAQPAQQQQSPYARANYNQQQYKPKTPADDFPENIPF